MQKIILFVEPNDDAFETPAKIGDIFMNRFAIDENDSSEILKIFELHKTYDFIQMSREDKKQKGMDPVIQILH